ncbi:MAG: AAA family ATPase, partial [Deltaproteobacteria bacterium]|nr:AAA family ATPase [Deltaproteobacteria bacterium]
MYENFFGFKERPFQLVPNPAYLFLSRSHEEALAHLTYATHQGDGFVAITGEVGTGKTTLCRAFIESLDEETEVAYIFNPKLTAHELLESICDEFGIQVSAETIKDLLDALNRFLMDQKALGKQVLLVIDEAQNLTQEVLEQVRLLSNLETSTEKLLQIVLVGQPEMAEKLEAYELRQLGQRISLSCHLSPLTFKESMEYIRHRVRIAARNAGVPFSRNAFRKIFTYSKGIPRLIHIVCDRALLTAYGLNTHRINGRITAAAIRELATQGDAKRLRRMEIIKISLLTILIGGLIVLFFVKPSELGIERVLNSVKSFKIPKTEITKAPASPDTPQLGPQKPDQPKPDQPKSESGKVQSKKTAPKPPKPDAVTALDSRPSALGHQPPTDEPARAQLNRPQTVSLAHALAHCDSTGSMRTSLANAIAMWGKSEPLQQHEKYLIDEKTFFTLTARKNGFLMERFSGSLEILFELDLPTIMGFHMPNEASLRYFTLQQINGNRLLFLG